MTLLRASEPSFMTADQAAQRRGYRAQSELSLRNALEEFCRERWPEARVVHELVMGARQVRADVVALCPAHIAAFEVKGEFDDTTRLLHQVGMYQLCVPEVWMVVPDRHAADARLIRHLLPSVGLLIGTGLVKHPGYARGEPVTLTVEAEAAPRPVVPEMMLEMLWAAEMGAVCGRTGIAMSKRASRPAMIKALLSLDADTLLREACTELRARDAMWRADAPIAPSPEER